VIASAIGGVAETVRDGIDGFHVAPGDRDALIDRILCFADAPDMARRMGLSGRARAAEDFSPERYYQRTMAVYRQVLSATRSDAA